MAVHTPTRIPIPSRFSTVDALYRELAHVHPGSSNLVRLLGQPAMTHAFFPGGNGLFDGEEAAFFPTGGILVLGSNFGAQEKFATPEGRLLYPPNETRTAGTWAGLRQRFSPTQLAWTFFTNAWPFLHRHDGRGNKKPSNLGTPQKWLADPELLASCLGFFHFTLSLVRPRLIVALGIAPAAFLSHVFPADLEPWRACKLAALDHMPLAAAEHAGERLLAVAITHPSQAAANARLRKPPYQGQAGEALLLAEAFAELQKTYPVEEHPWLNS